MMWPWPFSTMKNSSQFRCRCRSWLAPGLSTVQPTTLSAPADFLSIRNCTCMSIQPSSRLRPSTFGTFLMLVRNILEPSDAVVMPVAAFTALANADPIFSPVLVTLVLQNLVRQNLVHQNLVHQAADTLDAPPRNRW